MTKEENLVKQKEYYKNNKEKIQEKQKEYYKNHKEQIKEWKNIHREEISEYNKQYNKNHKEKIHERRKEYYNTHKFYNSIPLNIVFKKWNTKYKKYISLLGYCTILKTPDLHLKQSIMTKLGLGVINEDEAIELSGQILTQEDIELIDSYKCLLSNKSMA